MPISPQKLSASLCLAIYFFASSAPRCLAQTSASPTPAPSTSTSLPDAPQPQTAPPTSVTFQPERSEEITLAGTPRRLLADQKEIWTSPLRLRPRDAQWLLPLSVATGLLIGSDQHTMTQDIKVRPADQQHFSTLSNGGIFALGALPATMYLWSLGHDAPQAHETSILTGEALANSLAITQIFKFISRRDRPPVNNATGHFFSSSLNESSIPSNHAAVAWAMASVIGDEYPGWFTRTAVYGAAAGISVSRVLADQHFPSDVLVGSAVGWLVGHYVYRTHHNFSLNPFNSPSLPDDYGTSPPISSSASTKQSALPPKRNEIHLPPDPIPNRLLRPFDPDLDTIGSTNVPMDSWVYPVLERLSSMGLIPGQSVSIRPWTRTECLRQLNVAEELADREDSYSPGLLAEARRLIKDLHHELADEPVSYKAFTLESVYARVGTIAGPALADSYHFGQTWWNDFGRPLGRGTSAIAGYSLRAHHGRIFFYDRNELQHGPGNPAQSPAINQLINSLDRYPPGGDGDPTILPIAAAPAYDRQRPIELYAGVAFAGNALSLGKQELYWGPTTMGPLAFSSNAEPTYNLRFESTRPHPLPFFPSIGTYRFDIVLGKLSGHSYPARPWFNGQKADFNFGDNLEVSFTRWSIFWGVNHPITIHSFKENLFSFNSTGSYVGNGSALYGDRNDPGDRKSNFDFRYRLPFLRKAVTLYADAYSDDDPNPIDAPRRAVWNPGIYIARLPLLPHMDLRVEAVSSEGLPSDFGGLHFFTNNQYLDGNTNKGFLLGNAIGRDSRAIEARTGYWFSGRTRVEAGYRQNKGSTLYLPGGSTITDGFINSSIAFKEHWTVQLFGQYERFLIPSYTPGSHHNTSGWLQITWIPELSRKH